MNVDPTRTKLTYREVYLMAQGRYLHEWNYWSSLHALIANCNRDPKKSKPFQPNQFHPFHAQTKSETGVSDYLLAKKEMARRKRLRLVG